MPIQHDACGRMITKAEDLPPATAAELNAEEISLIRKPEKSGLPFAVTSHFAALAENRRDDPIRRQFIPSPSEALPDPFALSDPLGESRWRVTPRLVHQYRDRALLLAGGTCAGFCRYCFRRVRMSSPHAFISAGELAPVLSYIESKREILEILVSGGDPLTAADGELAELFGKLRGARAGILIRVCSRVPVTDPARISPETIALFAEHKPLRMVVHINHPRELSPETRAVLASAVKAGIPVHVQTVLLRGVNDSSETLVNLFRECLGLGLTPYYLFQLDLAPGTAHFRVPLREGLAIYRELGLLVSGLGLPSYAVDLPGGGGKIRLHEEVIAGEEDTPQGKVYLLKDAKGKLWKYPAR